VIFAAAGVLLCAPRKIQEDPGRSRKIPEDPGAILVRSLQDPCKIPAGHCMAAISDPGRRVYIDPEG